MALVDDWGWAVPRTKDAVAALAALGLDGRVLVVLGDDDVVAERSFANLPDVQTVLAARALAYDILRNDWVVFTDETLPGADGRPIETPSAPTPTRRRDARAPTTSRHRDRATRPVGTDDRCRRGADADDRSERMPSDE